MTTNWVRRLGARIDPPKRGRVPTMLRWASRIEAWPPRLWLGLQVAALLPLLGPGPTLLLAAQLWAGVLPVRQWSARAGWLLAAAACTALAMVLTRHVSVWIACTALGCAILAFQPAAATRPPRRRRAEHAMQCLQRGALCKCGYALALLLCWLLPLRP